METILKATQEAEVDSQYRSALVRSVPESINRISLVELSEVEKELARASFPYDYIPPLEYAIGKSTRKYPGSLGCFGFPDTSEGLRTARNWIKKNQKNAENPLHILRCQALGGVVRVGKRCKLRFHPILGWNTGGRERHYREVCCPEVVPFEVVL